MGVVIGVRRMSRCLPTSKNEERREASVGASSPNDNSADKLHSICFGVMIVLMELTYVWNLVSV